MFSLQSKESNSDSPLTAFYFTVTVIVLFSYEKSKYKQYGVEKVSLDLGCSFARLFQSNWFI